VENNSKPSRDEEVAAIAYVLWERYGKPAGCDTDIWHEAEHIWSEIAFWRARVVRTIIVV
jgi:hypothetical protein